MSHSYSRYSRLSADHRNWSIPANHLSAPLRSLEDCKEWIEVLIVNEMDFHLEDDPGDVVCGDTFSELFDAREAELVRQRIAELNSFSWGYFGCPMGYMEKVLLKKNRRAHRAAT